MFAGEVVSYKFPYYTLRYDDGDQEEVTKRELEDILQACPRPSFATYAASLAFSNRKVFYNNLIVSACEKENVLLPPAPGGGILVLDDEFLRSATRLLEFLKTMYACEDPLVLSRRITVANTDAKITALAEERGFRAFMGDVVECDQPFQIAYFDFTCHFESRRGPLKRALSRLDSTHPKCLVFASFSLRGLPKARELDSIQNFFQRHDTVDPWWNCSSFEFCMLSGVNMVFLKAAYSRVDHVRFAHALLRLSSKNARPARMRIAAEAAEAGQEEAVVVAVDVVGVDTHSNTLLLRQHPGEVPWEVARDKNVFSFC